MGFLKMNLRKKIIPVLLILLALVSFLQWSPFYIPEVMAQGEGVFYDVPKNIITFNQNTTFLDDIYAFDTGTSLTLLDYTPRFVCWSRESSPSTWLNETSQANEGTADDMNLPLKNSGSPLNDAYYWGNENSKFNTITINITTAGVGSWTTANMIFEFSTGATSFSTLSVTDNTNRFKTFGVNTIRFTPPTNWAEGNSEVPQ